MCVSEGKKYLFFRKFDVHCILETAVLRFALLPYYRRPQSLEDFDIQNCNTIANAKLILQKDPIYVSSTKVNLQYNFLLVIFLRLLVSIATFSSSSQQLFQNIKEFGAKQEHIICIICDKFIINKLNLL